MFDTTKRVKVRNPSRREVRMEEEKRQLQRVREQVEAGTYQYVSPNPLRLLKAQQGRRARRS
jgi:hypothetical protein